MTSVVTFAVNDKTDVVVQLQMNTNFVERLHIAFGGASMADVSRRLKIPHATVRNYYQGRLPAPEVLIKIANETGVSLNWLLIGTGEKYCGQLAPLGLGLFIEEKIGEMIDQKLENLSKRELHSGPSDVFDVESAVLKHDDPQAVMKEWFNFENREYPQNYGVVFFRGWETFSLSDKIEAIADAKKVLDRSLLSVNK